MSGEAAGENRQVAPYPQLLADLVHACTYRPDWVVYLREEVRDPADTHGVESRGLTLSIITSTVNSYPPHQPMRVRHLFAVPPATYNRESWQRWLFERFLDVERHECMEFFTIGGEKPYAPNHGPGWDPYLITTVEATDTDRRTSFRGELNPERTTSYLGRCHHCGLTNEACENTDPDGICCDRCSHPTIPGHLTEAEAAAGADGK